ncbi:MAG: hypothetical protein K2H14_05195 [Muribaculaceae bacterium]|nr:hypothetical protein [Muribaculaceae bacterium]
MKGMFLRYSVFVAGLYFLSLGVVCIVTSSLGTTPISSINYVLSLNTPLTLGMATFALNMLLIIGQFLLVKGNGTRRDRIEIMLQIPFSFIFSAFIDANMALMSGTVITGYPMALGFLAAGCLSQAVGVTLEVKPDVAIMSAEGFVKYASRRYNRPFGKLKVWFDISLVSLAALLSLLMAGRIDGIREGTVIAALSTGYLVTFLSMRILTRANLQRLLNRVRR